MRTGGNRKTPERRRRGTSLPREHLIERKFRIKLDLMLFQESNVFRFEIYLSMVDSLILNIPRYGRNHSLADAESPISLLPRKSSSSFVRPSGRVRFDRGHRFRNRQCSGNLEKQVHMVIDAADRKDRYPDFLAYASGVSPHLRLKLYRNCGATILCAEHNVQRVSRVRMRHVPHLRCSRLYITVPSPHGLG